MSFFKDIDLLKALLFFIIEVVAVLLRRG